LSVAPIEAIIDDEAGEAGQEGIVCHVAEPVYEALAVEVQ
jgi:hypothetical protein